mmetsp:Transcript_16036/g.22599  ORF Transcript_16036/g.22599 Transcript_16036/m.22599 type:complete len:733 (+) Transcript_16036:381-2579(+)
MPPFDDVDDPRTPLVSSENRRRNTSSPGDSDGSSPPSHHSMNSSRMGSTRSSRRSLRGRSSSSSASRRCMTANRALSIVGLVCIIMLGIYFQWKVEQLSTELFKEETQINDLQHTINNQAEVIRRFNESVTNSDVIQRLQHLEQDLRSTEQTLITKLTQSEHDINIQLNKTLEQLSFKVQQAETAIENEVSKVKEDVEEYVRSTEDQFSMENSFMVYQLAGTFTLLSGLISMWHMTAHLRRFNQPVVQRKILAILWMCPIYSVTSWFSLVFPAAESYLAIVKDFYEAYIIYQFLSFCIAVLGKGDRSAVVDLLAHHADHLTPPFRICGCLDPDPYDTDRALADAVLLQCQSFAMQFVFLRPLLTTVMFVLEELDFYGYGDSKSDYRSPQFYIILLQNLSVFVAFTGLLKFYHAVDQELAWCRPFAKFLCIKGVVFMTFWQGLALSILAQTTDVGGSDADKWAKSAQNFLICLEMLLFSIAHFYCFPTDEWEEGYKAAHSEQKFGDSIALGDFVKDLKLILKPKPKRKKRKSSPASGATIPEGEDEDDYDESQAGTSIATGDDYDYDEEEGFDEDDEARIQAAERILQSLENKEKRMKQEKDDDDDMAAVENGNEENINVVEEAVPIQQQHQEEEDHDMHDVDIEETGGMTTSATATGTYGSVDDANEEGEGGIGNGDNHEEATETTGLLSSTSPSTGATQPSTTHHEEILHPSIFTTVADLALEPEQTPKKE